MKRACDSHVHVFGPPERYPFSAGRKYTPPRASVEKLLALQEKLELERVVIVQASPYGTDNRCLLAALHHLGERDPAIARRLIEQAARRVRGNTWIKLSAPHRVGGDIDEVARLFIAARAERLVWGTDWPHPGMGPRTPEVIQPFDDVDDAAALARLRGWAGSEATLQKILVDNPARLYDFQESA